ncbi:NAD(P)/FAD-dependent oxidoreductase [Sporomusa sp.]|uniref:NAD(P)/FAD-dependent oxidoreductase n=1 Tax=Sporomusa sp. TaxID=2078658 RepID=UPI002C762517|nr:FAD-dependent oxidoreductase [Sporomusa sp.]HWR43029.1 FAD-dependent oxidoreductase [Sporomusa sp.]
MYELIIIGGGPAGMTAAVYAARKQMNALMLMKEFGGQPMWTMDIENYMGYQFVTGPELMEKFDEQVRKFPIEIKFEEVTGLAVNPDGSFTVTSDGGEYQAESVIVASGKRPRRLEVPGETEFTGRGVSYCATCDGPLFAGKTVAVIGGGNSALQAAIEVSKVAEKVYLISLLNNYQADPIVIEKLKELEQPVIEFVGYTTKAVKGSQAVEKLVIVKVGESNEIELDVQGVFVEIGLMPNSEYCEGLLNFNEYREVITDCRTRTNIPGLFAAGDVNNGPDKQIVIAAGDGAKAALVAYEYLLHKLRTKG